MVVSKSAKSSISLIHFIRYTIGPPTHVNRYSPSSCLQTILIISCPNLSKIRQSSNMHPNHESLHVGQVGCRIFIRVFALRVAQWPIWWRDDFGVGVLCRLVLFLVSRPCYSSSLKDIIWASRGYWSQIWRSIYTQHNWKMSRLPFSPHGYTTRPSSLVPNGPQFVLSVVVSTLLPSSWVAS